MTDEDKQWFSEQLKQEIRASEDRTAEKIRDTETTLLTEFHKWARPAEMRSQGQNAKLRAFEVDLEYLAERVTKLEGGK